MSKLSAHHDAGARVGGLVGRFGIPAHQQARTDTVGTITTNGRTALFTPPMVVMGAVPVRNPLQARACGGVQYEIKFDGSPETLRV